MAHFGLRIKEQAAPAPALAVWRRHWKIGLSFFALPRDVWRAAPHFGGVFWQFDFAVALQLLARAGHNWRGADWRRFCHFVECERERMNEQKKRHRQS